MTCATRRQRSESKMALQNWLGHASAKLTLDTYAHSLGTIADMASIALMNAALTANGDTPGIRGQKAGNGKVV